MTKMFFMFTFAFIGVVQYKITFDVKKRDCYHFAMTKCTASNI